MSTDFCNVVAREKNLDPGGYAGVADIFITLEMPLPWPRNLWQSEQLPDELRRLVELWLQPADAVWPFVATPRPRLRPLAVVPDPESARRGYRRVMVHRRPRGRFADFNKTEYLLPEEGVGPFFWALLMEPSDLPSFERYREAPRTTRDLLVCNHGSVDAACAKFGYPLYEALQAHAPEGVRVWRVSHFGGHVFAPTLLELPAGRYWAYIDGDKPTRLLTRQGDVRDFYGHYRGWSGLEHSFLQAAEREALMREGWAWLDYAKSGVTVAQDDADEPSWAEVRLDFESADGRGGAYKAYVEREAAVATPSSTGDDKLYRYPQYRVTALDRIATPTVGS